MADYRLISFTLCPYVQRAAIVLLEKGAPFERTDIDLADKPDWFLEISPLGKVPVLVVSEDGREEVLFESAVIAEYLDETIEPRLHPADPLARAKNRAWIEFASALLGDLYGFYAGDEATHRAKREALDAKFARLEGVLGDGPYFDGADFRLVDAAFAPAYRYFELFDDLVDHGLWRGRPKLAAYRKALAERPSVREAVVADYREQLLEYVKARKGHLAALTAKPAGERG